MSRLAYALATTVVAELLAGLFIAVAVKAPSPRLIWNASASAPIGLYRVMPIDKPHVGALIVIMPPPRLAGFLAERRYLPLGIPLLKQVAATSGTRICRNGTRVTIGNSQPVVARLRDSHGRPLPVWRGCRSLREDEIFLLNAADDSMDGRYFGAVPLTGLLGEASPVLTRDVPGACLQWRGLAVTRTTQGASKGKAND